MEIEAIYSVGAFLMGFVLGVSILTRTYFIMHEEPDNKPKYPKPKRRPKPLNKVNVTGLVVDSSGNVIREGKE